MRRFGTRPFSLSGRNSQTNARGKRVCQLPSQIRSLLISTSEIQINAVDDGLRRYWSLESGNIEKLEFYFEQIYRLLEAREQTEAEPMLNILTTFDKKWNVFIFPRDRQRPDCFFSQGDDQILMSPASVEMGGIAILPRPEDFEKIDTKQLQEIYQQVTMEQSDSGASHNQFYSYSEQAPVFTGYPDKLTV
jgi:hypothetical protein